MTKHLLIVDDDPDFCAAVQAIFPEKLYHVTALHTAAEALPFIRDNDIDLAMIDGMLGKEYGMDLIRDVSSYFPGEKVVFVSNYFRDSASSEELVKRLGVSLVLRKPITPVQFKYNIEVVLKRLEKQDASNVTEDTEIPGLAALRRAFVKRLPSKLKEIHAAADAAAGSDIDSAERKAAVLLAHNLAGSAGSYGVASIGELAAQLEVYLSQQQDVSCAGNDNYIAALKEEIDTVLGAGS